MTAPKRKAIPSPAKGEPRRRVDWDAVERDYRTGKFTLRELAEKHGVSHVAVGKQAKKNRWSQDLADKIRQATNAKLMQALVAREVTAGFQEVTETVAAAAEVNTRVILGHRQDIANTRSVASSLLLELANSALLVEHQELLTEILAGEGAKPDDWNRARTAVSRALSLGGRVGSVKALADTFDKLQLAERRAFGIPTDAGDTTPPSEKPKRVTLEFVDVVR